ncbi:cytochrome c3 family protein [Anaeromyxobacter paludicola]|uniref:Cytochrome c n=1 Tax=Anaeromyxobacter paludicola TaxID=2918171 RepID=A0ABN6N375_9BACT|nr:cytochrome c3 family protein [Anaeromyxobacter paludicola]BDG07646.1 cytochrome c [Anaeromyxobacter paludicola]
MKLFAFLAALVIAAPVFAAPPESVTLKAKNGDVQFPHKTHQALGCKKCHEGAPKKIEFTKDSAHKLCISCHTEMSKGPGEKACTQCHKKA